MTEFTTPIGRLVQGGFSLRAKTDDKNKPVIDPKTGQQVMEQFCAIAFRKDNVDFPALYAIMFNEAKSSFPTLFDANNQCLHPRFAWKLQDGDGVDKNGKSVKDKPGFAGHWVLKMQSRYAPKCFHAGKYDPMQQIPNPDEVIKCGFYVRISGTISGNGVGADAGNAVPGLYVSANLVSLEAFGEVIQGGPDATKAFAAPAGALPPGASAVPVGAAVGGLAPPVQPAMPALPGMPAAAPAVAAMPAMPALPGAAPAMPPLPGVPAVAAGPRYIMQPSAMGATREQLHAQGWTDILLIQQGHMIQVQ